jgi:hypothetical protein
MYQVVHGVFETCIIPIGVGVNLSKTETCEVRKARPLVELVQGTILTTFKRN